MPLPVKDAYRAFRLTKGAQLGLADWDQLAAHERLVIETVAGEVAASAAIDALTAVEQAVYAAADRRFAALDADPSIKCSKRRWQP